MSERQNVTAYEPAGVSRPLMIAVAVWATIGAAALCMGVLFLLYLPSAREGPITVRPFAEPRLQTAPSRDLAELVERQQKALRSTQWRNREAGVLSIPIAAAMKAIAQRGQDAYAPLPNATSAGGGTGRPATAVAPPDRQPHPGAGMEDRPEKDQ